MINNLIDIEDAINKISERRDKNMLDKKDLEIELSTLNNKVRSATTRLSAAEYASICRRQDDIKKKINRIQKEQTELKSQIREKESLKNKIKLNMNFSDNDSLIEKLILLRDKYRNFASDPTRVSSMRTMASQISQELDSIIKS